MTRLSKRILPRVLVWILSAMVGLWLIAAAAAAAMAAVGDGPAAPEISVKGGVFTNSFSVTLKAKSAIESGGVDKVFMPANYGLVAHQGHDAAEENSIPGVQIDGCRSMRDALNCCC